jgi:hypothetical protein
MASSIGWSEAVARLAGERTRAEMCAGLLKKHGDKAAISRGTLAYGEAKAEVDAVIAGLDSALAQGQQPNNLSDLEVRLERAAKLREVFAMQVIALLPGSSGQKSVTDISGLGGVVTSLIEAFKELVFRLAEKDQLTRETIRSQLKVAAWRDFCDIPRAA